MKFEFSNSITKQTEEIMNDFAEELASMGERLEDPMEIIRELKKKENICTPGFLMRRQIQYQPELAILLEKAVEESNQKYIDLFENRNVAWPEKLVEKLSSQLEKFAREKQNEVVKKNQWMKWLNDESMQIKRELAIKLSFLLKMDNETTTKFLLSGGHEPFNVRNPLDYICIFCKSYNGDWRMVQEVLKEYEKNRPNSSKAENDKIIGSVGQTCLINSEISIFNRLNEKGIDFEQAKEQLIKYMYSQDNQFTRRKWVNRKDQKTKEIKYNWSEYFPGYSLQNRDYLLELTRYLVKVYPIYKEKAVVEVLEDGYPNLVQLTEAFIFMHEWTFVEKKAQHEKDLFNRDVYSICNAYDKGKRLSAIKRIKEFPNNAKIVERKDVLLMGYLFISGYLRLDDKNTENELKAMSVLDTKNVEFEKTMKKIINLLDESINEYDESKKIFDYICIINVFLECFSFEKFYPPFILDRFVLFALAGEEIGMSGVNEDGNAENIVGRLLEEAYLEG